MGILAESNVQYWLMFSIPVMAALVGWGTNLLAIKMTFYPLEFFGKKPIGWQGIIPSKAAKVAGKVVDLLMTKLIDLETLFEQIEPEQVAKEMKPKLKELSEQIINQTMSKHLPIVWAMVPQKTKNNIYADAEKQFPSIIINMMSAIKGNIHTVLNVRQMVVNDLVKNKSLLNELFLKCGAEEFQFIGRSGLYFGFAFGILQMLLWFYFDYWWLLPLGGLLIGYATNWLALKLIFRPRNPVNLGFYKVQGLFIKRQNEVSKEYAKIIAEQVLTVPKMFDYALKEGPSDLLANLMATNISSGIDKAAGLNKHLIKFTAGSQTYNDLRDLATEQFVQELPKHVHLIFNYANDALDLEQTLAEKMMDLPPDEYEGTLRPAFQEEEMILILVGAALGCAAGFLQVLFLI